MPSGWKYDLITNICSKIVDGDHNPPVAQKQISPYIMLSSKNINEDAITNLNDVRYLSKADFDISNNRTKVTKGDVLFTSVGSIGRTCIYDLVVPVAFQRSVTVMTTYIYNRYFKLFLDSPLYQNYVFENARGTAQKGFYINQIENSLIPIPPYNEQIKIVEITEKLLFFVKKIEEERNNIIENIYRIKSEILDLAISGKLVPQNSADEPAIELLRKINPAFKPCDNSHYENLPNGWCVCLLKDIFEINMGQSPDGDTVNNENGVEFHQGKICFTNEYLLPSGVYTSKPTKIAEANSLLLCVRAPVGILNITKRKICIGRGLCSLKPKYETDNKYWFYILSAYKDYFEQNATGSTFKAISGDTIKNTVVLLPPLNEQIRITKTISSLFSILDTITAELQ